MPRARKHLVCLSDTPYYHITSRCVRRAFLCGTDKSTGNSYEHRRAWIEDRLRVLSSLFSLKLCAYAVMSNHYHLVVKLNPDEANDWVDDEVLGRWTSLFRGPLIVQQYQAGVPLTPAEEETLRSMTAVFRSRLSCLSWFMKCLNEPIARKANAEDECTGHFWEARFQSQPLCSEQALIAAMVYVDLNPIRARIANTPEQSDYTSIRARLQDDQHGSHEAAELRMLKRGELSHFKAPIRPLMEFSHTEQDTNDKNRNLDALPIYKQEYLNLVDATGRIVVRGKRGKIDPTLEPILSRLHLSGSQWIHVSTRFKQYYRNGQLRLTQAA
jgi:REP element-mobilizing transposase RayT